MIECPNCDGPLADLDPSGETRAVCANCRYSYRILTGELDGGRGAGTLPWRMPQEFALRLPGGQLKSIPYTNPPNVAHVRLAPGDRVSLVYTLSRAGAEELVRVLNYTVDAGFDLVTPGREARVTAARFGCGTALLAFFVLTILGLTGGTVPFVAAISGLTAFYLTLNVVTPRGSVPAQTRQSMDLLRRKHALERSKQEVEREIQARIGTRRTLEGLAAKMRALDPTLYAARLESMQHGLDVLDRQDAIGRELLAGYDRAVQMLEIEIESMKVADQVSDDAMDVLDRRLAELDALRDQTRDLERQLAANDEVERALRAP